MILINNNNKYTPRISEIKNIYIKIKYQETSKNLDFSYLLNNNYDSQFSMMNHNLIYSVSLSNKKYLLDIEASVSDYKCIVSYKVSVSNISDNISRYIYPRYSIFSNKIRKKISFSKSSFTG